MWRCALVLQGILILLGRFKLFLSFDSLVHLYFLCSSNAVCNVVLIDFSSAKLYTTTTCTTTAEEVMQRFQQANNGVQLSSLQGKWETRPVSTSSDAVLRGADTLPADEACALIHCTMQENFSEVMALFAINMEGGNYERFLKRRGGDCFWRDLATIDPIVDTLIETIRRALGNLQAIRESCTEAQRTAEVQAAVAAVFRLRPLIPKC